MQTKIYSDYRTERYSRFGETDFCGILCVSFLLKEPRRVVAREKKERFFFYSGDATIA